MLKNKKYYSGGPPRHYLFSNKKGNAGFTLIELLVVISIIGMLASIVLASVHSASIKAQSLASNIIVVQYRNALAQAYNANGYYPGDGNSSPHCLGVANGDGCNFYPPSPAINSVLANYYPTLPVLNPMKFGGAVYGNVIYTEGCSVACQEGYVLSWALPAGAPNCGIGHITFGSSDMTWCTFP